VVMVVIVVVVLVVAVVVIADIQKLMHSTPAFKHSLTTFFFLL